MSSAATPRAALLATLLVAFALPGKSVSRETTLRESRPLTDGWQFVLDRESRQTPPESGWQPVNLPHTWNALDGQDGGDDYFRGVGWYRREGVLLDASMPDGDCILAFSAASIVADVWLDGHHLGQHRGAFATFAFDITPFARRGERQRLEVRVDNRKTDDIAPLSGDFTMFGGLYREVRVKIRPPVRFGYENLAAAPVRVVTKRATPESAILEVSGEVRGARDLAELRAQIEIRDADGKLVSRASGIPLERIGGEVRFAESCEVPKPRLWRGVRDPYLYYARVELLRDERTIDRVTIDVGIRTFRVDPQRGFLLNEEPYDLRGVSRHQDRLDKGWAISREDIAEDFRILRELGCTAVRLAHYPHDEIAYEEADRAGLVVWAEIPLVDQIHQSEAFSRTTHQQLREMIEQHFNHPSICFWGVHNEVTAPWKAGPDPTALVADLHRAAKRLDPSRLTVCAACDPVEHPANWQTDLTAFNRYYGWYAGKVEQFGPWADGVHAAHPKTPLGISEYGAGASATLRRWPATQPVHNGPEHPEQWQTELHRGHWMAMRERPYLWCKFIWNGFDFACDSRREGDLPGRNDKGLVTFDRKTRKEAFHWYRAAWASEPVVHIAPPLRSSESGAMVVRVFSNCDSVELFVAGKSVGERTVDGFQSLWELTGDVAELKAVARRGELVVESKWASH
ncbi:MAG: glycoside hydrolase family 2 TIM barrel-domain containing protein [Phycisphaerae bacterium]|nr:glycoside hydrolase family 2 TIM barrel-domain containing protein [Phycisphaerae bacterium]